MKKYELKLTSAMVIDAKVVRAGTRVHLDEHTAKDFLRRGKAELIGATPGEPDETPPVDLGRMNKAQLLEHAAEAGVEANDDMTKAQILEAIQNA